MRFVHSLNTKPLNIGVFNRDVKARIFSHIIYYSISVAWLKKFNQEVVLYTDELGKSLLEHLPYDEIKLIDVEGVCPRFWAAIKMWALGEEPLYSVHIDGDVFLKSQELIDDIKNSDYDLLCQCYESAEWYVNECDVLWRDKEFCKSKGLDLDNLGAYNTGIVGFGSQELKNKFIEGYKELSKHFSQKYWDELEAHPEWCPDCVCEQQYIYQLAAGSNVKKLIGVSPLDPSFTQKCDEIRYQHILNNKIKDMDKALESLKKLNIEIYNDVCNKLHIIDTTI